MKVYSFGAEHAPVILLLPGTCCHWKGNFGRVIPLLADSYRVLCISYDGFDETEHTEFPTILEETEKIETYIQEHSGGHIRAAYGCSLGGSFVGLLAARGNIHMDYGILGSSDLDQASPIAAKLQTNLLLPLIYPVIRGGQFKSRLLQKRLTQRKSKMGGYVQAFMEMLGGARPYHNIMGADKHALLLESLRVLKKGGVFVLHDNMKPQMYGDMNAFVEKLKSMGFAEVRYVETAEAIFGSKQRAAMMMLGDSAMIVGRK